MKPQVRVTIVNEDTENSIRVLEVELLSPSPDGDVDDDETSERDFTVSPGSSLTTFVGENCTLLVERID